MNQYFWALSRNPTVQLIHLSLFFAGLGILVFGIGLYSRTTKTNNTMSFLFQWVGYVIAISSIWWYFSSIFFVWMLDHNNVNLLADSSFLNIAFLYIIPPFIPANILLLVNRVLLPGKNI